MGGITLGTHGNGHGPHRKGGPTHKIKAYDAQFWSACTARQSEDILAMKEDLFGYDSFRIPRKYLPYNQIDPGLNRLVTLPPRLYKAGRDPPQIHLIFNTIHRRYIT